MANSETSKARPRLEKFCVGNGLDLGFGGDPITPSAIAMDMPQPYTHLGEYPQHLSGDATNLYWFRDNVLDYVYSSHLLEDYPADQTAKLMGEWLRVVKSGGLLIIYCPDQPTYVAYCHALGNIPNPGHKIDNFGLQYLKDVVCKEFLGKVEIIHEIPMIDDYCFDLVLKKL